MLRLFKTPYHYFCKDNELLEKPFNSEGVFLLTVDGIETIPKPGIPPWGILFFKCHVKTSSFKWYFTLT